MLDNSTQKIRIIREEKFDFRAPAYSAIVMMNRKGFSHGFMDEYVSSNKKDVFYYHANYAVGLDDKVKKLKNLGFYFLD